MKIAGTILPARVRAIFWRRALVIGVIAAGTSCGISSIAPYNPDGAAGAGSGGATGGTGGTAVATGGAGHAASGGSGGNPATGGSGGASSGGRGGQVGPGSGGRAGQPAAVAGGRGGQMGPTTGGASGVGAGGSLAGSGGSSGGSGASGAGSGGAPACQSGDQRCSGKDVQSCSAGQWDSINACGMRQTCNQTTERIAKCLCNSDPVCSAPVSACASVSTIASCAQDPEGCFYQSGSSMCTTGTCNTASGSASCCACTTSGPACTAGGSSQTCALSLVCGRTSPTACTDMNWAQWPMPNGPADVSDGAANPASYTDNGDGTVTDRVTGLMWEKGSSGPYASWSQAVAHCPTLTLGGHNDWRLPTRIELLSLVDYGVVGDLSGPRLLIDTKYFPMTASNLHWTSTPRPGPAPTEAFVLDFNAGNAHYQTMTLTSAYAMCVR